MVHRVFTAIALPEQIKNKLLKLQERWHTIPGKWTSRENMHITLVFLGSLSNEELQNYIEYAKNAIQSETAFTITIESVSYGPTVDNPRMIWANVAKSVRLAQLRASLAHTPQEQAFMPHSTLCRIHQWKFKALELEERPTVAQEMAESFSVKEIRVMESRITRAKIEYALITTISLL